MIQSWTEMSGIKWAKMVILIANQKSRPQMDDFLFALRQSQFHRQIIGHNIQMLTDSRENIRCAG